MYLKCYAGDTAEFVISNLLRSLDWPDIGDWDFIFTAKESLSDSDSAAKIQRNDANGITLNMYQAASGLQYLGSITLKLVHADTNNLLGKTLFCDIQGYKAAAGGSPAEVARFAYFRLRIDPAVTRQTTTSITINS